MWPRFTIDEHLIPRIENEIRDLANDCKRIPGLVLTEDDLKCQLFRRLLRLPGADQIYQSEDGLWASPVHTEVPWFDENDKLTLRPDITIAVLSRYPCRCDELKRLEDEVGAIQEIKLIILPPITN